MHEKKHLLDKSWAQLKLNLSSDLFLKDLKLFFPFRGAVGHWGSVLWDIVGQYVTDTDWVWKNW